MARDYSLVRAEPAPRNPGSATTPTPRARAASRATAPATPTPCTIRRRSVLGCADCHGGNPRIGEARRRGAGHARLSRRRGARPCAAALSGRLALSIERHPQRTYTLLNREAPEFIRFTNPSDYRVARDSCGACHMEIIEAAERSLMASGAMLIGGASYNNGILPFKNYILGEAYTRTASRRGSSRRSASTACHPSSGRAACCPSSIRCRPGR